MGSRQFSPCPERDPCPTLLPAELRPVLFCFRFLRSFWVTSLQCRGFSSRKDGRLEELAFLGELPAQAELTPCTPSQQHVLPSQGRGSVGSHGTLSAADNCPAPLPGGYLCSGVPWLLQPLPGQPGLLWGSAASPDPGRAGLWLSLWLPGGAGAEGWEQAQPARGSRAQALPRLPCPWGWQHP